jgi:Ca2+-binding EF-hand superfamily protein
MASSPEIPDGMEYIFRLFVDLKNAGAVSYSEMRAYQDLTGERLTPFEVECVRKLDEAYMRSKKT